jgi:diguanylate cyclase (GGDEF)-like protein
MSLFVAAIALLGAGICAAAVIGFDADDVNATFWLLTVLVVVTEVFPINVRRSGGSVEEITMSTTFSFALLILLGSPAAIIAQGVASILGDVVRKKTFRKVVFNLGQYAISLAAAGAVMNALLPSTSDPASVEAGDLPAILVAAGVFFVLNNGLIDVAVSLEEGIPLTKGIRANLGLQGFIDAVLLGLAPIAAVAAGTNLTLVPLLVLPLVAVARTASTSLRNAQLVDELRNRTKEISHRATHDDLTGLPNRTLFRERIDEAIALAAGRYEKVAVLLMDIDGFKEINDTLGHHNGDVLLEHAGNRLSEALGEECMVARLGGDEFGVLIYRVPGRSGAREVAELALRCFKEPFAISDLTIEVRVSLGIALYPDHGAGANALLQRADVAMYQAKDAHTELTIYAPEFDSYSPALLSLVPELRHAIESGEMWVCFQPITALPSGEVHGVEALIRWEHPNLGPMPPDTFIPIAERTGLIRGITLYVLNEALSCLRSLRGAGYELSVAINLSANGLHDPALIRDIEEILRKWRLDSSVLELEITESTLSSDPVAAASILHELSEMGVRLAIDDFGTGYSSLSRLRELPVSTIKIDKSFVLSMHANEDDAAIVRSTIDLAHNLGLRAVAEGVEDRSILDDLVALSCDFAQGDYLGKPLRPEPLTKWLTRRGSSARLG